MKTLLLFFYSAFCILSFASAQTSNPIEGHITNCGPIPAVCYPTTTTGGLGVGITFVGLNQISNPSGNPPMLEDFTCTDSTWLVPGVGYQFEVHTGFTYEETVIAWIDFSNDGSFDSSEIVYRDSALVFLHLGTVTVPTTVLNSFTPIRMRVGSEYSGNTPPDGCNNLTSGQYEDYTIYYGVGIGINETEKNTSVEIFPNPFHDQASINAQFIPQNAGHDAQLKIYNAMGALVRRQTITNQESQIINRNNLPDGLYFFELTTDNKQLSTGKFVIE